MNYKQQVTASELVSSVAVRTGLATSYDTFNDGTNTDPVVLVGTIGVAGTNSASIRILDQEAGVDMGFKTIIGRRQEVRTTGVAQILVEPTGPAGVAPVAATGTFTLDTVAAGVVVTIAGIALTEGVQWAGNTLGNDVAAGNLKAAIEANVALNALVSVTVTPGAVPATDPAVVTLTAKLAGTGGNAITTTSSGASVVASAATLLGGVNGNAGNAVFMTPVALTNLIGDCARRGLKVELWYTANAGTRPAFANFGTAVKMADFEANPYWPVSGLV